MKRTLVLMLALTAGTACSGRPANAPMRHRDLAASYAKAAEAEQLSDARAATEAYMRLLGETLAQPQLPHALEATLAALDALVTRRSPAIERYLEPHALAFRRAGEMDNVLSRLEAAYESMPGNPFLRGAAAAAAHRLALYLGDPGTSERWRNRTGCVRSATVIGPLAWPPITSTQQATPVESPNSPLGDGYAGPPPFSASVRPMVVSADDCDLPLLTTNTLDGLRAVIVDVDVPKAQTLGLAVRSSSASAVVAGGKQVFVRGYELGGSPVEKWGTVDVDAGRLRIVVRVGSNGEDPSVQVKVFGQDGRPLSTHAPKPGERAAAVPKATSEVRFGMLGADDSERCLVAQGMLALGDARAAEHLLEQGAAANPSPLARIEYARAVAQAQDLPDTRAIERERAAYDGALTVWPASWEAILGHAQLTALRRGTGEGRIEALDELRNTRKKLGNLDPIVRAYEAASAAEGDLHDVAEQAYADYERSSPKSPLSVALSSLVHERSGKDRVDRDCRRDALDRNGFDCLNARVAVGDRSGALAEIARLRTLRGSRDALRNLELAQYLALGDGASVLRVYDAMRPAERTLGALALAMPEAKAGLRAKIMEGIRTAADTPGALPALYTALRESPSEEFESEARSVVEADRKRPSLSNAGTAVLRHVERYTIDEGGLLRYAIFDLRRVSGTTDVDQGVQAGSALIEGRDIQRILRRRIYKPDGRVLEPDQSARGAQGHADLSHLEKGDYVEQTLDGFALPGSSGQIVVDTPDLLPERTSIEKASIEIRRPASLAMSMWSHNLLGPAKERVLGAQKITTFEMHNAEPRRIEDGVPKMDREVAVSFGTATWDVIGRAVAEGVALLADHDPMVNQWARESVADATVAQATGAAQATAAQTTGAAQATAAQTTGAAHAQGQLSQAAIVDKIVAAVGKKVKVASGAVLSDSSAALSGGPQATNARAILELGQGSRTWLAYRALGELGISTQIVIAEREPFSADPNFPAHFGRFEYPLLVAHTDRGEIWLDLDVQGPPLPAGRISPELRGRSAMTTQGKIIAVKDGQPDLDRDEVDMRLKVDDRGDATGSFSVLLRGRTAQTIADALERVVGTDRRDMLEAVVLGWLPWANVNEVVLSSSEGSWQISLRAQVMIPGFAQLERATWAVPGLEPLHSMFPRGGVGTLGSTFASQGKRESALAIDNAFQYHVHRRVEIGADARLARPLASVDVNGTLLKASRSGTLDKGVLEEDFALSISTGTLDASRYPGFATEARRVDDVFQTATRVHKNR